MNSAIIKTQNLRFSYTAAEPPAPVVLDGVDLEIEAGSFVAVLGHNGSGKSTLAKHMNAILLPSGGKVYVDGIDTVDEDRLLDIRRTVGMYQYREHAPHLLSGGQKQRVAIAGVIAMAPRCIVLDEPTAMLDPIGRSEVLRTIKDLNRAAGVTVVLITHHMDEAAQADRLVVMSGGHIIADGPPREVFQRVEDLKAVGLTVPETTELLWQLRQEGLDVPLDALTDEECAQALYGLLCGEARPANHQSQ